MAFRDLLGNAAFDAAAITAAVTMAGWFATWIYRLGDAWFEAREKKRAAIVRFYADCRLRAEGLVDLFTEESIVQLAALARRYEQDHMPFKMYGTQVSDTRSQDRISLLLHKFSSEDAYLIRKYILIDRLLVLEYEKLQSDSFQDLSAERQIAAMEACAETVKALTDVAQDVQSLLESWPELASKPGKSLRGPVR